MRQLNTSNSPAAPVPDGRVAAWGQYKAGDVVTIIGERASRFTITHFDVPEDDGPQVEVTVYGGRWSGGRHTRAAVRTFHAERIKGLAK